MNQTKPKQTIKPTIWISRSKFLSKAGREVMIKSVLQAILSYAMSILQLLTILITSI